MHSFNVKAFAVLGLMTALAIWHLPSSGTDRRSCDISGRALDEHGRPVAAASILLCNEAGAALERTRSRSDGRFAFAGRTPGKYRIAGASTTGRGEMTVDLDSPATCAVNLHLRPGSASR